MRDAKMWRRETERALRTGQSRSRCPCTLCLFGRPLLRTTQATHLRDFGRHPRKRLQPQGEPRDSSDEEWEAAYAALDPVFQCGWGNRITEGNEVGAQLVRDVFEAADEMHDNAMSEMEGNTEVEDVPDNVPDNTREERPALHPDRVVDPLDGMELSEEGENSTPWNQHLVVFGYPFRQVTFNCPSRIQPTVLCHIRGPLG